MEETEKHGKTNLKKQNITNLLFTLYPCFRTGHQLLKANHKVIVAPPVFQTARNAFPHSALLARPAKPLRTDMAGHGLEVLRPKLLPKIHLPQELKVAEMQLAEPRLRMTIGYG